LIITGEGCPKAVAYDTNSGYFPVQTVLFSSTATGVGSAIRQRLKAQNQALSFAEKI
jgi:hypothetical protein